MDYFLAFVNSLKLSNIDVESGSSDSNSPVQSPRVRAPSGEMLPDQRNIFKRKKRKRPNLSSSTRLQQTKKAETLFLRRRVLELEEQITQLKIAKCGLCVRRKGNNDKTIKTTDSKWVDMAEAEHEARPKSEETNCMLKLIVAKQTQSSMSLQARLIKQAAANEMDLLQIDSQLPTASSPQTETSATNECIKSPIE
ncbi:hypothetical protein V7S43_018559 [Phytophthora oleae]|uniref:BZIP domain-containing protein n=1 Tax=Phytophthora oleae TaxID=2107226 RepID=A0ABD3EU72_9STRA